MYTVNSNSATLYIMIWNVTLLLLYSAIVGVVAYVSRRFGTGTDMYLVTSRTLSRWSVGMSAAASVINPLAILFAAGAALALGSAGYGTQVAFAGSFVFAMVFSARMALYARKHNVLTLADYVRASVGHKTEWLYMLVSVFFSIGICVALASINILLLTTFLGVSSFIATTLSFLIICAYLVLGGFASIVRTDIIQLVATMLLIVVLFIATLGQLETQDAFLSLPNWFTGAFWVFAPVFFFSNIMQPAMWQPIIAAKDDCEAKWGMLIAGVFVAVLMLFLVWISFTLASVFPGATVEVILTSDLPQGLPSFFVGVLFISLYASLMSTLDTSLFFIASTVSNNMLKSRLSNVLRNTKYLIVATSLLVVLLANFVPDFFGFALALYPMIGVFALPFLFGLFWKLRDKVTMFAISAGLLLFAVMTLVEVEPYTYLVVPPLLTGLVCYLWGRHPSAKL